MSTAPTTTTTEDLPDEHKRVAIKWLMWDRGMTVDEARAKLAAWPDHREANEAVDVATFIVEECHGR